MRDRDSWRTGAACLPVLLMGCSPGVSEGQSEEDLNAMGPGGPQAVDPHPFVCAGKERLLVDFSAEGLSLQIRRAGGEPPLVLTASAQGMPFRGPGIEATMEGQKLRIVSADGSARTCLRQAKG